MSTANSGGFQGRSEGGDAKSRVLAATDIVELIGQSVKLIRRGGKYLGLCPFHQEKTPSFNVHPDKQFFYCFGCKASGNAIDFVIKRDRVEFKDALITLAKAANIDLPKWTGGGGAAAGERQMLLDAQSSACGFFEKLLAHADYGKAARDYLDSRGFTAETLAKFRVGLALDSFDALMRSQSMKKFTPQQLHLGGLVKARENGSGFYDTFRGRIMFPIRDETGRVIAFGGRILPGSDNPAKYLNSPETPLFHKSRVAFGMDLAKQKIVETRTVAVVEGYTDVMMAHQYGASNVVSVLGTALTADHVKLLKRFADRIVLLFDADTAGDAAVDRAVEIFITQPIEVAIASMPEGVDPDEYLLEHGADGFQKLLADAQDALAFKWAALDRKVRESGDNITVRQKATETYLELIAGARLLGPVDPLRWGAILERVSRLTKIAVEELYNRFRMKRSHKTPNRPAAAPVRPAQVSEQGGPTMGDPADGLSESPADAGPPTVVGSAERWILGALLLEPGRWHDVQADVQPADFRDPVSRELAEIYWSHQRDEGEPVFNEFLDLLTNPAVKALAAELAAESGEQVDRGKALMDAIAGLKHGRLEQERREVTASMAENKDNEEEQLRRLTELARLASQKNKNF